LAGVIVAGVATFIVVPSAHADVFGVGTTFIVGSMLVPPGGVMFGGIVPGGGFAGISGVDSGNAAPLLGGPPGVELHTVADGLPSGAVGETFPVVVMVIGVGMAPNGDAVGIAAGDVVVADDVIVTVVPGMDVETVLCTVKGAGTGTGAMEGDGSGGGAGGGGTGTFEPAKSVMNDVAG
jgi:hypothetical protein